IVANQSIGDRMGVTIHGAGGRDTEGAKTVAAVVLHRHQRSAAGNGKESGHRVISFRQAVPAAIWSSNSRTSSMSMLQKVIRSPASSRKASARVGSKSLNGVRPIN